MLELGLHVTHAPFSFVKGNTHHMLPYGKYWVTRLPGVPIVPLQVSKFSLCLSFHATQPKGLDVSDYLHGF
jgi:hypothetical protein